MQAVDYLTAGPDNDFVDFHNIRTTFFCAPLCQTSCNPASFFVSSPSFLAVSGCLCAMRFNAMKLQLFLSAVAATSMLAEAVKVSLNSPLITPNTPFPDAFVSFSIEFSSFPDFAGESAVSGRTDRSNVAQAITRPPTSSRTTC